MKKIILSLLVLSMLVACERSNDINPTISQAVTNGTWRVTLFTDSGNDETADFNGYSFSFESNGTLIATKNGTPVSGTWNTGNSSSKFIINLGPKIDTNKPLGELTDDWKIISTSSTEIRLTDDNASSNEFLTFTRN